MFLRTCLMTLGLLLSSTVGSQPPNQVAPVGEEIVNAVRDHFFDERRAQAWVQKHRLYFQGISDSAEFAEKTRKVLADLNASHTAYYTPADPQFYGLAAIFARDPKTAPEWDSIGVEVTPEYFVRRVLAGGPAAKAGFKRGDKILLVNGKPFHPVFSFRGHSGQALEVTIERQAGQPLIRLSVEPRRINPKAEWLQDQKEGSRILEGGGKPIAYVPLYSCSGEAHEELLRETLSQNRFQSATALVLDFRDGWGGCRSSFVNIFNRQPPVLTQINRQGPPLTIDSQWRKPLYLLINGGSRSGKEAVAYAIKKHHLGTLVGQRTAGAVLGGRAFHLSDGSLLYLAVANILLDGERLEGIGVVPDVEIADSLPHANGADPQLEHAIQLAARRE